MPTIGLKESEERYRRLVESSADIVWEVDGNGTYSYLSPSFFKVLGYKPEEAVGRTPFDFMLPAEAESVRKAFTACIGSSRPIVRLENTNVHKDGHLVVLETSGEPVLDGSGNLIGYLGIDRDVTERKKAEEELRESEIKFKAVFEGAADGIIAVDPITKKFAFANPSMCRITGYSLKELLALGVMQIHPKKDLPYVLGEFQKQAEGVKTLAKDLPVLRKDGEVVYCDVNSKPIQISGKNYMVGFFRDTTERKAAEDALRESEGVFNGLLLHSPVLVYIKDDKLRIVKASDNFKGLLGKPTSELIGKSAMDLFPPEFAKTAIADDLSVLKGNRVVTSTEQLGGRTYMTIKFPIRGPGGRTYLGGFSVDITERKAAEDALKQSAQLKVQFVRNVSHELRTPLTSMRMGIGLFGERVAESGTARDKRAYEIVDRNVLRLVDTVNMILDLSRAQAGITEYARQPFDLAKEIRGVAAELKPIANAKRVRLVVNAPKALRVKGDAFAVSRVLVNIMGNAIKFTDKGAVTVTAKEKGGFIEVRVKDTGCGMTKKELSGLFTEFFKASPSKIGTGLGLAITKQIVEAIGGRVWAESGGKGTTLIFTIPVGGK